MEKQIDETILNEIKTDLLFAKDKDNDLMKIDSLGHLKEDFNKIKNHGSYGKHTSDEIHVSHEDGITKVFNQHGEDISHLVDVKYSGDGLIASFTYDSKGGYRVNKEPSKPFFKKRNKVKVKLQRKARKITRRK